MVRRVFQILWLATALATMARAEGHGLSLVSFRTQPGNLFAWDRWAEAVVLVKNESANAQTVRVVLELPGGEREGLKAVFGRYVTLAAQSKQEVRFVARFPSSQAMPRQTTAGFPVRLRLMKNEAVLVEDTFYSIPLADSATRILWGEGPEDAFAYHLRKNLRAKAERSLHDAHITIAQTENLPYHLFGYDPFDLVVLSQWRGSGLDALQTESLLNWVRAGGRLLVIAGSHWFSRPNPALAEYLPLWPAESYPVSILPSVETWAGDLGIADGVRVFDGPRAADRIVMGDDDQPILLCRPLGHGAVWFLAVDIDRHNAKATDGMLVFMSKVVGLAAEGNPPSVPLASSTAGNILGQLVALKIVSREMMALGLGLYVLLVIGTLVAARLMKRAEWAYAVVVLLAGVGFLLLYGISQRARQASAGQIERARIYLATLKPGDSCATLTAVEGYFPNTARTLDWSTSELASFDSTAAPIADFAKGAMDLVEMQKRDTCGIGGWMLKPNTLRAMNLRSFANVPGNARFGARLTRDGLRFEIQSDLPWKLDHAFLKWNRFVIPVPDIVPEKEIVVETWKHAGHVGRYETGMVREGTQAARNMLRQVLLPDALIQQPTRIDVQRMLQSSRNRGMYRIVMGGFTSEDPHFWKQPDSRASDTSLGLWLILGNAGLLSADDEFWMPAGVADLEMSTKEGRISYLGDGNFAALHEETVVAFFRLPACLQEVEIQELLLHGNFDSLHFQSAIQVGFGTATEEPKQWIKLPMAAQMRIPHGKQSFAEGIDSLWVRVNVTRRPGVRVSSDGTGTLGQSWTLRGLDLSLRGKKLGSAL